VIAHAQDAPGAGIRGRVIDALSGAPLIGAYVEITGTEHSTYTLADGAFFLPIIPAGEVSVTASQLGYTDLTATVTFEAGQILQFELDPQPIILEGIQVHQDRLEQRRHAAPVATSAFGRETIALSSATSAFDFIERQTNVTTIPCDRGPAWTCVVSRGQRVLPRVYIDERPGTLEELRAYPVTEIYTIETYGRAHIRAYTIAYMDRVAKGRERLGLFPILIQEY
jgi:hypothetical protein